MNRKLLALVITTAALTGVAVAVTPAEAVTRHHCTLQAVLFEDGSWSGERAYYDGRKIADHWRVNDWHIAGTITPDEAGRPSLNTAWAPGYRNVACRIVYVR